MTALKLTKSKRLVVPETSVEEGVATLLQLDDWRYFHTEFALTMGGRAILEKDMADALFIRYLAKSTIDFPSDDGKLRRAILKAPAAEVLWVEFKRIGGRATGGQRLWHAAERARGAMVIVAGIDFEASSEGFLSWYRASGLARRQL